MSLAWRSGRPQKFSLPPPLSKRKGEGSMPSEAWYAAVAADAARTAASYEGLVELAGQKKAEAAVKKTLQQTGQLPPGFVENSASLPHCFKANRGDHVRMPRCDREERGHLLLKPDEALDLAVLFTKMHTEGTVWFHGVWQFQLLINNKALAPSRQVIHTKKTVISRPSCGRARKVMLEQR